MSPGAGYGAAEGAQERGPATGLDPERERLRQSREHGIPWRRFGPYLAERQWGTVREDYSASGDAWDEFTHEHARSPAYRWGEDGLLGICDDQGLLCLALALWNETDPILNERLFLACEPSRSSSPARIGSTKTRRRSSSSTSCTSQEP